MTTHHDHDTPPPLISTEVATEFAIRVHWSGPAATLRVCGEVDLATAPLLGAAIDHALVHWPGQTHLHLGQVTFFDCAGLGALIASRNAALREGIPPPRITSSRQVRRLMDLAGVSHLFGVEPPTGAADHDEGDRRLMTNEPRNPAGDTWLTPRDAELLHTLADPLSPDSRRDLAQVLRRAGDLPEAATELAPDSDTDDHAGTTRLPELLHEPESRNSHPGPPPADGEQGR